MFNIDAGLRIDLPRRPAWDDGQTAGLCVAAPPPPPDPDVTYLPLDSRRPQGACLALRSRHPLALRSVSGLRITYESTMGSARTLVFCTRRRRSRLFGAVDSLGEGEGKYISEPEVGEDVQEEDHEEEDLS